LSADGQVLGLDAIRLGLTARDKDDAIVRCGRVLVEIGAVDEAYIEAMRERERVVSTFVGRGVAIPHGTGSSRQHVRRTALAVLQFPAGVPWNGEVANGDIVSVCVAIAANNDENVGLMSLLARLLLDEEQINELRTAVDPEAVLALLRRSWTGLAEGDAVAGSDVPATRRPSVVRAPLGYPPVPGPASGRGPG
jgi:mannitol/fructose-specific phosphotransferase system IIA component